MKRRATIALGFLSLIAVGALALASPWARTAGEWGNWYDAAFTSCSAVCVTGLSVLEIFEEYTRFGQLVLMALVESGALGLMALGTFLLVAVGRRLSYASEFSLMNAYGVAAIQGVRGLVVWVVGSTVIIEAIGTALLYWRLGDWHEAAFYSVMSFCNAGFSIRPGSLAAFANEPIVLMTLALETIFGGIGFLVVYNLCTFKFRRRKSGAKGRLSLHTTVVLRLTGLLLAVAFVLFAALEWNGALGGFPAEQKLYVALYQAVTPRSCGFAAVPTESLKSATRELYEVLMFIGGAPGSVAAGIKVTTLAVIVCTVLAMCRGERDTVICRRTISYDVVRESIVIVVAMVLLAYLVTAILNETEVGRNLSEAQLRFEAISAVTTTGLSVGDTTSRLSAAGRAAIMAAMFFGRLGALTVVLMIGTRESRRQVRYPNEELVVG